MLNGIGVRGLDPLDLGELRARARISRSGPKDRTILKHERNVPSGSGVAKGCIPRELSLLDHLLAVLGNIEARVCIMAWTVSKFQKRGWEAW